MIGRLIDGRYRVRSRIARGGMATVYLATDLRLERRVAIKVMHGHLADDSQYKARFIQEARSAARLAHPNVVNVYDQGQDADTAYLVMEYLPGITLRDLLEEHRFLTTDQAIDIMEAVLSGLAAAHKNGIVHRDLKPENVLLADDGRIKISDFGLARAATAQTATGNALLGTIAYLSPELVTRGVADTRSDIYAVGIMLYEMLAGEQPFKGEQPFQIAHQHANDTVGVPSAKNSAVPTELDELVLWATARDPDQRPRDATTMLEQLLETQADLKAQGADEHASQAQTAVFPQRTMVLPSPTAQTTAYAGSTADATQVIRPPVRHRTGPVVADSTTALAAKSAKRKARGFWLFALVLILAALAGGTGWYFSNGPGALVTVPAVSGESVESARQILTAAELTVADATRDVTDPSIPAGQVVGVDPESGAQLEREASVTLLVSIGPAQLPVPAVASLPEGDAVAALRDAQFTTTDSTTEFNGDIDEGLVIRALGSDGTDLATVPTYGEQQPVTLVVSLGAVPDVAGMSIDDATATLESVGLIAEEGARDYNESVDRNVVVAGVPRTDGAVRPGDTIDLQISDGPAPVTVPDVSGMTRDDAVAELEALGLTVSYNPLFTPFGGALVTGTNPEADELVSRGSNVALYLQLLG
ncbi:Stk1 family PASTA domain-containing Ser/Thr kinase [Marisediminicola senii]